MNVEERNKTNHFDDAFEEHAKFDRWGDGNEIEWKKVEPLFKNAYFFFLRDLKHLKIFWATGKKNSETHHFSLWLSFKF